MRGHVELNMLVDLITKPEKRVTIGDDKYVPPKV